MTTGTSAIFQPILYITQPATNITITLYQLSLGERDKFPNLCQMFSGIISLASSTRLNIEHIHGLNMA